MHYRNHLSPPVFPASWASTWGEDRYGLWMTLNYKGATLTFRWIIPGTFMMGSPKGEEGRVLWEDHHEVILEQGFWLADTPVTQAFWQAVNSDNPSQFKGETLPVETISWEDTQQFIQALNQLHPDLTVRLPHEAEWEYACRAGTSTPFSFAGEIDVTKANYRGVWVLKDIDSYKNDKEWGKEALKKTSAVKSYQANPWGLYDMHGNVWEWCQDEWQDEWQENLGTEAVSFIVSTAEQTVATKSESRSFDEETGRRVIRGGSWFSDGEVCRSAYRIRRTPDYRGFNLGVRLALGH